MISLHPQSIFIYILFRTFVFYFVVCFWFKTNFIPKDIVKPSSKQKSFKFIYDVLCSVMLTVTWVQGIFEKGENPRSIKNRTRMIAYYSFVTIENIFFLGIWWIQKTTYPLILDEFLFGTCLDYDIITLSFIISNYIAGMILMVMYYELFHPTKGIVAPICKNENGT